MINAKKHKEFHDRNLPGSGAVFHNNAGDLHSPMIQWNTNISPTLDVSIQRVPQVLWNGPECFTPLAESQRWLCDNTYFGKADGISRTLMHHDFGYAISDGADQDILTDCIHEQSGSNFDMATSEAQVNKHWPYGDGEKFRYNVTLQAPTACQQKPSQTYSLTVVGSIPPPKKAGLAEYRTFVHVSFEEEDQRSNPDASWRLWKEGRGLKEAYERKGKILAVEYADPSKGDVRNQGPRQIQLEEAFVDGFCITWSVDTTTNVYEAAIPLKFNFLSTDFTRLKGVKGVLVRMRPEGEIKTMEDEPEMCYCVVKLFGDHGAERKLSNDKTHVKKRIEKLNKQIIDRETGADFGRRSRNKSLMNGGQIDIRPQDKASGRGIRATALCRIRTFTPRLLPRPRSFHRPVHLRGNVKDDPNLHPICLSDGSSTSVKDAFLDNQHSTRAITLAPQGAADLSKKANLPSPKVPEVSIGTSQSSSPPANYCSKSVACFYLYFTQSGKQPQGSYYAIYLADRTSLNLKVELAEKLQIDPCLISRLIWVNSKGLKVLVDDDMVQQLPEALIMSADICELLYTEMAPSSAKCSRVEVKLVF
ncbi:hypothetical protein N7517_008092 [Penicillium concentricum]|uniref:Grh/CP2 DB domain-containing protein n=1 Tax=Penicillium concentricum TaxID=293559 RepID=A0A9W9RRT5_9EURO|nr:uncharacterized protein N7517_008092 [Penicillium concentricum]KAJ5365206.1 hypothetical protein N7517_008092 [Penicillium concentricum]